MARYGLLTQGATGVVLNVVEASEQPAGWISVPVTVGPGHSYDGATWTPPAVRKRRYTLSEWIDAMTDAELDVILDYVNGDIGTTAQKRAARRVWEYWRALDRVDMALQRNQDVLTWLVNNSGGVWTAARRTELIG